MALGRAIVRQLELESRGNVLERWLAHHVAELIISAEQASGPAKEEAERRAVDLILRLWLHRRALPSQVDPLGGYREAIAVLSRLMPDADPWRNYRHGGTYEGILQEMFRSLTRIVIGGILLTHSDARRSIPESERWALEEEELFLLRELEAWEKLLPRRPNIDIAVVDVDTSRADDLEGEGPETPPSEEDPTEVETELHSAIESNLRAMQDDFAKLIAQWRRVAPHTAEIDQATPDG